MTTLTWTSFNSDILRRGKVDLGLSTEVVENIRLILCSGTLTANSSLEDAIAAELTEAYGYSRQLLILDGELSGTQADFTSENISITASGASLQFDSVVALANGDSLANKAVTSMIASSDLITVSNHGRVVGDKILFTGAGTIAGGLSKNVIYYVQSVSDANNFKVSATGGGLAIDLDSDSSGALLMRCANGWVKRIGNYGSIQAILDGQSRTWQTPWSYSD